MIQELAQNDPNLRFSALSEQLLGVEGKPDRSLYKFDGIHPNAKGYRQMAGGIFDLLRGNGAI